MTSDEDKQLFMADMSNASSSHTTTDGVSPATESPGSTSSPSPASTIRSKRDSNLVPEVLLAVSKDARYLAECQKLIKIIMTSLSHWIQYSSASGLILHPNEMDETSASITSALLSWMLYAFVVIRRQQKTLGMLACGLDFEKHATTNLSSSSSSLIASFLAKAADAPWKRFFGGSLLSLALWTASDRLKRQIQVISQNQSIANASVAGSANFTTRRNGEGLRGMDRRAHFEQQRQAMMQRATAAASRSIAPPSSSSSSTTVNRASSDQHSTMNSVSGRDISHWIIRIKKLYVSFLQFAYTAVLSPSGGPHEISNHNPSSDGGGMNPTNWPMKLWISRLSLAIFCVGVSENPNLMYRLLRLPMEKAQPVGRNEHEQATNQPLVNIPPNSNITGVVGILILIQMVGTAVPAINRQLVRWWIDALERRNKRKGNQLKRPDRNFPVIFDSPGGTLGLHSPMDNTASTTTSALTCGICRHDRSTGQSSCPISCGHVFCWNCLQQWVTAVRPECPLCRSPCRPQDVLALYQY